MTTGQFWSRGFSSSLDIPEEDLVSGNGPIDTALKAAFVDACLAVESAEAGSRPYSLASVTISMTEKEGYRVEATVEGKSHTVVMQKCQKCLASTYQDFHPFNGCEAVLVQEVMDS